MITKAQTIVTGLDPNGVFAGLWLPPIFRKRQKKTRFRQEWQLTLEQYLAMMRGRPIPPKRKQRGSIILSTCGVVSGGGGGDSVVVNVHFFANAQASGTHTSAVRLKTNGELTGVTDGAEDGGAGGEWWSAEPVASIGDSYEVRALSSGKTGTWSTAAAADDIWVTMTANREWEVSATNPTGKTTSAVFEVGPDGVESADDSALISCAVTFV